MKNLLQQRLNEIQLQYLELLRSCRDSLDEKNYDFIVDAINSFWFSKMKIIKLYINSVRTDMECYLFTGSAYLDIAAAEQYPFVTFGKIHVVDDPLYKFTKNYLSLQESAEFHQEIKTIIYDSIEDNIGILEKYAQYILILPISYISVSDERFAKLIAKGSEQYFFSMFLDERLTKRSYLDSFDTIEDIEAGLKPHVKEQLIFSSQDNIEVGIVARFRKYLSEQPLPISRESSDAVKFQIIVNGFIAQSMEIMLKCCEYQMVPYLRYEVTYRYVLQMCLGFMIEMPHVRWITLRLMLAHHFYKYCDIDILSSISMDDYVGLLRKIDFQNSVLNSLPDNELTAKIRPSSISSAITTCTKKLEKCIIEKTNNID